MKYLRSLAGILSVVANDSRRRHWKPRTNKMTGYRKRKAKLQKAARKYNQRRARGLAA